MKPTFAPKLFTTLKKYSLAQFLRDSSAGIIVALIAFPLSIALGIASGVSPETGLYTAVIGCAVVAILGGSRVQVAGPTGAFVVIVYGIILNHGLDGLAIATLMAGLILVVLGLFRLGSVISMIPYPITTGFTSGIAITIAATQIQDFFGLRLDHLPAEFFARLAALFQAAGSVNPWAFAVGAFTLLILVFWPKLKTPVPPALIAITLATILTLLFKLPVPTVGSRFGELSAALPSFGIPSLSLERLASLLQPALTIAALAAIESLLSAVVADGMIGGNHRPNVELVAQGSANMLSGLFGGIPVTGAIARTAANAKNGGRTPVAALVSAIFLFVMLQFLLPLAQMIPMSTLAAVLLMVAYNMGEWEYFKELRRAPRSDYLVFLSTFVLTVIFDLVVGILIGLLLAIFLFMRRMTDLVKVELIVDDDGGEEDRIFSFDEKDLRIPRDTVVYRIRGPFFFGAAEKFMTTVRRLSPKATRVLLDLSGVPAIDATAFRALDLMRRRIAGSNGQLILVGLDRHPRKALEKYGFLKEAAVLDFRGDLESAVLSLNKEN